MGETGAKSVLLGTEMVTERERNRQQKTNETMNTLGNNGKEYCNTFNAAHKVTLQELSVQHHNNTYQKRSNATTFLKPFYLAARLRCLLLEFVFFLTFNGYQQVQISAQ